MEASDRDHERKAGAPGRQLAHRCPEVPACALFGCRGAGRPVERAQRDAFRDGADPARGAVGAVDAQQLLEVRLTLLPGKGDETVRLLEHRLDEVRPKEKVVAPIRFGEGLPAQRSRPLGTADDHVRIRGEGEAHRQAEPSADARGGERADVGEAKVHDVQGQQPSQRVLERTLRFASMRPHLGRGQVPVGAERDSVDRRALVDRLVRELVRRHGVLVGERARHGHDVVDLGTAAERPREVDDERGETASVPRPRLAQPGVEPPLQDDLRHPQARPRARAS